MKNKHFLGLVFLGLGLFTVSATMKVLHLQGAAWLLIFADALLALGLHWPCVQIMVELRPNLAKPLTYHC